MSTSWMRLTLFAAAAAIWLDPAAAQSGTTLLNVACTGTAADADAINAAVLKAGALYQSGYGGTVVVRLSAGVCRLNKPINIGKMGGGGIVGHPLTLEGAEGGGTEITGGFPLQLLGNGSNDPILPPVARSEVSVFKLTDRAIHDLADEPFRGGIYPEKGTGFMLLQGNRLLHVSRWPARGYAQTPATPVQNGPKVIPQIPVPSDKRGAWSHERFLWTGGFWTKGDWTYETSSLTVDPGAGIASLEPLHTTYPEAATLSYAVFNAESELNGPNEYVVDPSRGIAIVWQGAKQNLDSVETSNLLRIYQADNVLIQHIAFRGALGNAIFIHGANNVSIEDCLVADAGQEGILVDGGQNDVVSRTVVADIGEIGITLRGGNTALLTPGGDAVVDSVVTRFAQLTHTDRPGILLTGVGMRVQNSYFSDSPWDAILFQGNDHLIQSNEFSHVVREASDSGAVYGGRNTVWRGTLISGNYFHDIEPDVGPGTAPRGIYFDDFLSGNEAKGNVFYNVTWPVYVHGGSDNQINGNLFACVSPYAILFHHDIQAWTGLNSMLMGDEDLRRAGITSDNLPLYRSKYPDIDRGLSARGGDTMNNDVSRNVLYGNAPYHVFGPALEQLASPIQQGALPCVKGDAVEARALQKPVAAAGLSLALRRNALSHLAYFNDAMGAQNQ